MTLYKKYKSCGKVKGKQHIKALVKQRQKKKKQLLLYFSPPDKNSYLLWEALICWEHEGMKRKFLICIH